MAGKLGMKIRNNIFRHPELDSGSHLDSQLLLKLEEILNQVQNDVEGK